VIAVDDRREEFGDLFGTSDSAIDSA